MIKTATHAHRVNRQMADEVARIFKGHPWVYDVLLFGSVARGGVGEDLDLILISDDRRARDFIELLKGWLGLYPEVEFPAMTLLYGTVYAESELRISAAAETLGENFHSLLQEARTKANWAKIDLFVFPRGWRDRLQVLQSALPHEDPDFMEKISREAVRI